MASELVSNIKTKLELIVEVCESEQKLLSLLERHLKVSKNLLHKWVRTGQVRINGKRCHPFDRVRGGDIIRLPPFALKMAEKEDTEILPALPKIVERYQELICFCKPSGLPTHGGTGHRDSLAARLRHAWRESSFIPVPVHRLDKDTSGLILVAESFQALRKAQEDLQAGFVVKEYVCWVSGRWPKSDICFLEHFLEKKGALGVEKMQVVSEDDPKGKKSLSKVTPLKIGTQKSLLLVRIFTGRTHQIRVQMADLGHPILGDHKYGHFKDSNSKLLLHACRIILKDGHEFVDLPAWPKGYEVLSLPPSKF
ncbi:MAG: RluA family pseudouridine synthase [Desulfovibrionaceae bacterium]|nr:RluA family pseudouridine synthase [Desulfovibrionaceae bacterium]